MDRQEKSELQGAPLYALARYVQRDWKRVYYGAQPYLDALATLATMSDYYGADDADTIVSYFLANATRWRGTIAREVKAELNRRLDDHRYPVEG